VQKKVEEVREISEEELDSFDQMWALWDGDHSGELDKAELRVVRTRFPLTRYKPHANVVCSEVPLVYCDDNVANRNVWDFAWEIAHAAVSRRPPIPLYTMVARAHMYTYDAGV
jgi:hypothetical protein